MMPAYLVEQMKGERTVTSQIVNSPTPLRAATQATGKEMKFRTDQEEWVRVSEKGRQAFEFVPAR